MRINKYLSEAGVCSRRKADEHILNGKVKINGRIAVLGDIADDGNKVTFKDKPVNISDNKIIYALNKPRGIISTANDERGRRCVLDFVPKYIRVYPVGRLDKESEGLILLTNDGDLAYKLSHPKHCSEKEYRVTAYTKKDITESSIITKFLKGVLIDGVMMRARSADVLKNDGNRYTFNLVLTTGYNRQIRKMCDKIGLVVTKLERIRIANINIMDLKIKPGEYKKINLKEILSGN
jgi:pseudouridine synthase